jgi:glycosyltransferase involved in cell wall biosynthesis
MDRLKDLADLSQMNERKGQLPLVTIITPAYNRASFLEETIQSVLFQDYPCIEYIVLDDGSTDNTREVLEKYSGTIYWESHFNMGETRTTNKGFGMAKGEIVCVVNSDDPLLPGAVHTAVEFLQSHSDILVAYPDWIRIGPDSEVIDYVQVPEFDYLYMLRCHQCIVGPGAFIRRKSFDLAGKRDSDFKYVADFEYWLRLGLYGSFARIPETLATFRVHPNSASFSHKGTAMANEHIRVLQKFYSLPNLPPQVHEVRAEAFSWAHYVAAGRCESARKEERKHYLKSVQYYPLSFLGKHGLKIVLFMLLPKHLFERLSRYWRAVLSVMKRYHRSGRKVFFGKV